MHSEAKRRRTITLASQYGSAALSGVDCGWDPIQGQHLASGGGSVPLIRYWVA